jgi:hypothetical protein
MGFTWVVGHLSCLFVGLAGRSGFFTLGFQFEVLWIYLAYILHSHSIALIDAGRFSEGFSTPTWFSLTVLQCSIVSVLVGTMLI